MSAPGAWNEVLVKPGAKDHLVQLYQDDDFLARGVEVYLKEGFATGAAAVLVMTPPHWKLVRERLGRDGIDAGELERQGRLTVLDAAETLAKFMVDGVPDRARFRDIVGGVIGRAAASARELRAFGEMVDLLWQQGQLTNAIRLEQFWNELGRDHRFSLLCAYKADPWDPALAHQDCRGIFQEHSHCIPLDNYDLLNDAVMRSMDEILGRAETEALRPIIAANQNRLPVMPGAQASILWLYDNLPDLVQPVLTTARRYYERGRTKEDCLVAAG